ncbi:unnamed protein product [Caenorhabditis bovis]|uniref:Uncharacterized protein n=1 Tax=Caenorhabditis bovis TaxID=2654633 RepID=A0A8S1F3Y5_9PELO|nr:unnamed protein product [Caenorhabditis bovis]
MEAFMQDANTFRKALFEVQIILYRNRMNNLCNINYRHGGQLCPNFTVYSQQITDLFNALRRCGDDFDSDVGDMDRVRIVMTEMSLLYRRVEQHFDGYIREAELNNS